MSIGSHELVIYTAANMPENNANIVGSGINSGVRASFDDLSSQATVVVYSSSASDTGQALTLTGRSAAGIIISDIISLDGLTRVTSPKTYERVLKAHLNEDCAGIVTVSGNGINKIANIPIGESGFHRPFYDVIAKAATAQTFYEKVFVQNINPTLTLEDAKVVEVSDGLYSKIDFAIEDSKKSEQFIVNRTAIPTGVSGGFGNGPTGIIGNELAAGDYQGVWLKLSLGAGEASINSFYEVQISGTTV
jgi:hypothetical protein